ncbi:MAG: hypothetical protein ACJAQT_003995 [Akkermansiaceae bacterium]|jgi:hypothetical protein
MARLPDELINRIKREVPLEDLCREYSIELSRSVTRTNSKAPCNGVEILSPSCSVAQSVLP